MGSNDDIFGIHAELKLPPQQQGTHLGTGDDDNTELESISGRGSAENIDIDLEDPQVGDAATKIQAGFRGSKARKEVKDMKQKKNIDIKMPVQSMDHMEGEEEDVGDDEEDNRMTS